MGGATARGLKELAIGRCVCVCGRVPVCVWVFGDPKWVGLCLRGFKWWVLLLASLHRQTRGTLKDTPKFWFRPMGSFRVPRMALGCKLRAVAQPPGFCGRVLEISAIRDVTVSL